MKQIKRILDKSIRYQFLLVFTLSSILPIVLLGTYAYTTTLKSLKRQTLNASLLSLNKLTAQLDLVIQQVHQYIVAVSREKLILAAIEHDLKQGLASIDNEIMIGQELDTLSEHVSIPMKVLILSSTRHNYDNYVFFDQEIKEGVERITDETWYRSNDRYRSDTEYLGVKKSYVTDFETEYQHYFYRNLLNPFSVHLGIVLLEINTYIFDRMLASIESNAADLILMVDEQYNLLSSSHGYFRSKFLSNSTLQNIIEGAENDIIQNILGEKRFSLHTMLLNRNWRLIYLFGVQSLLTNTTRILLFTVILLSILFVAELLLYRLVNTTITKPIIILSKAVYQIQTGNFEVYFDKSARGEIGILAEGFNKMIVDIKNYINKIKEEEVLLKKYELSALQAQIKPHFLSNTLHNVKLMADLAECENISKAVVSLIHDLRPVYG